MVTVWEDRRVVLAVGCANDASARFDAQALSRHQACAPLVIDHMAVAAQFVRCALVSRHTWILNSGAWRRYQMGFTVRHIMIFRGRTSYLGAIPLRSLPGLSNRSRIVCSCYATLGSATNVSLHRHLLSSQLIKFLYQIFRPEMRVSLQHLHGFVSTDCGDFLIR